MIKIHVKVVTGEEFTISQAFFGSSGRFFMRKDAEVQASVLITKTAAVPTDQGKTLNVAQIVYHWIEE